MGLFSPGPFLRGETLLRGVEKPQVPLWEEALPASGLALLCPPDPGVPFPQHASFSRDRNKVITVHADGEDGFKSIVVNK